MRRSAVCSSLNVKKRKMRDLPKRKNVSKLSKKRNWLFYKRRWRKSANESLKRRPGRRLRRRKDSPRRRLASRRGWNVRLLRNVSASRRNKRGKSLKIRDLKRNENRKKPLDLLKNRENSRNARRRRGKLQPVPPRRSRS